MKHLWLSLLCGLVMIIGGGFSRVRADFHDGTTELGLILQNASTAWVDVNGDGWVDIYNGGKIWLNQQGKAFRAISVKGRGIGADFDNDGHVDLLCYNPPAVLRNIGDERFEEIALPELPKTVCRGAACADFNNDGFVDIYLGGYENWDNQITYPDILLLNHKGQSFELKMIFDTYRARGITACDFDEDADMDVYVSNYRLMPNVLWVNGGEAAFTNASETYNAVATSDEFPGGHSIGAAWGDFDNDGHFDLFTGNFAHIDSRGDQPKSRFLKNLGKAADFKFKDLGTRGVFYQESYASPAAADFDNDGKLDLFFSTVYVVASFGKKNFPVLFRNMGQWNFRDVTAMEGLDGLPATYQAAWADFDNDGDLDLVAGGKLFINQGTIGAWLKVKLVGDGNRVNRLAIGTQVRVQHDDVVYTRQVEAGTGEGNANELTLHFGLGRAEDPLELIVKWPNGKRQTVTNVAPNTLVTVSYAPDAKPIKSDAEDDGKVE